VPLGEDQVQAVRTLSDDGPALRVVLAAAGHGKTALTTTAAGIAEQHGRRVVALAATNKAVAELQTAGLTASTIARWRLDGAQLPDGAVVVVDEVSQVSTRDAAAILNVVIKSSDAQLWCLGDEDQGRSVKPGGLAAELARLDQQGEVAAAELTVNRRQIDPDEQAALAIYRAGRLAESQDVRRGRGWEHDAAAPAETRDQLACAAIEDMARHGAQQVAVLAVSHVDCEDLADRIRTRLRANGQIRGPEVAGPAWGPDDRHYAAGDRILRHANTHIGDRRITNGTTGRITQVTGRGDLDVLFDDGRTIILPTEIVASTRPDGSPNLSHAWARTIDGAQGGTWDQVHLLATPNVDRHTLYVGQSRGRNPTHTWNVVPGPDDEIHGNVVADDRGPDEIILSAAARRPDMAFAAWDDPNVLDRQLRAELAEHEHALAAGPPDRSHDWACCGLTDIHDQGRSPGKDVHHGDHGEEEAAAPSFVHQGVQGRHRRAVPQG
jgi:ATP-dependent exoDNAse (exonuclease V) alpha subunit